MENLKENSVYVRKFDRKIRQFNHSFQLPEYFRPLIGNKTQVVIAELGAALINTIGDSWPGVDVKIVASDIAVSEYQKILDEHKVTLHTPVEYQDMEHLTYPDCYFDIVHCVNALDHTPNPKKALEEMKRVCKFGGWIYLRHSPDQMKNFGGHHYWNIRIEEAPCKCPPKRKLVFEGKEKTFKVSKWRVSIENDLIVALWQKT